MSDYIEVPSDEIRNIGNKLMDISGMLLTIDSHLAKMDGEDDIYGKTIAKAADSANRKWMKERHDYYQNIEDFSTLSTNIADKAEELDGDIYSAINQVDPYIPRAKGAM